MADKNHHVADIGKLLLNDDPESGPTLRSSLQPIDMGSMPAHWSLLRVAPKEAWTAPDDLAERTVLVLEGIATFQVDDWRYSAASGHLIVAGSGASLAVVNDGPETLIALFRDGANRTATVDADMGSPSD